MIDRRRFTLATSTGSPHCPASIRPIISHPQPATATRSATALRSPLLIKTGAVKGSAGSCYLEHGKSKLICSLYGPRQSTDSNTIGKGAIRCTCKYAPYLVTSNSNSTDIERLESQLDRAVEGALSSVVLLDRIPNSQIEFSICILDDECGFRSCDHLVSDVVNAAVVAVVAAAIEVQDVVSSCQVGLGSAGLDGIVMDPSAGECCSGHCTICYSAVHNEVVQVQVQASGQVAEERVKEAVQWAIDGAVAIREVMVKALGK